jgi:hypothetical protein
MTIQEIEKVLLERTRKGEVTWVRFSIFRDSGGPATFSCLDPKGNHFIISKRFAYGWFSKKPYYTLSVYSKDDSGFGNKVYDGEEISSDLWDTVLDVKKQKEEVAKQSFIV